MPELFYSPLFCFLAVIGVIMTGISKSGFAGGAGVVAVPLLALVMPLPQAAALMLPVLIFMDIKIIRDYRQHVNYKEVFKILPAAILGIVLAGFMMGSFSDNGLMILLAIISIVFSAWKKLLPFLGNMPGAAWLWGSISGLTSTLIHAGGPPINLYFLARQLPKMSWLASVAVFFGVLNIVKIVPYFFLGQWKQEVLISSIVLLPFAWLGVKLGKDIQHNMSEETFMLVCRVLLFSSGVMLLIKAIAY